MRKSSEVVRAIIEAAFIKIASKILMDRNPARSRVTSRYDNNAMWYMGEKLERIAKRIFFDYPQEDYV